MSVEDGMYMSVGRSLGKSPAESSYFKGFLLVEVAFIGVLIDVFAIILLYVLRTHNWKHIYSPLQLWKSFS